MPSTPIARRTLLGGAAALPLRAQPDAPIVRFALRSVRIPFSERVREAWVSSWKNQKRNQEDYRLNFVRLYDANGRVGLGEAKMPRDQAEARLRTLVGRTPADLLDDDSLRGILIAVYDLAAQAAGVSIARYLNPRAKRRIVPTWWSQCFPPALMASEARLGYSLGYRVHKVKARPWEDPIAQAGAICDAIGRDMKVWVDANSSWANTQKTIEVTRALARFPQYFAIESPIPRADIDGYRTLRRAGLPLKISEHVDGVDLLPWTREKLLDAWIVGAANLGPYVRNFAAQAAAARTPIWIEHSIDNGIAQVFQAHQCAAWNELEYSIAISHVLADDCMLEPFTVRNGFYELPSSPGLGVQFDDAAIDRYRLA